VLGLTFTCVQAFEYSHAAFTFSGNVYGATFFMATGFHGFHVIIGTTVSDRVPDPRLPRSLHADAASRLRIRRLVLHFVDVVWIFLFACIYVVGFRRRGAAARCRPLAPVGHLRWSDREPGSAAPADAQLRSNVREA
jgi:cytochrome c oxidase subunit 3